MSLWDSANVDYAALGFRCGVEIHQQLATKQKLFCRCPVGLVDGAPDARILRHMRPTLSEMGEYDGTALMEKKTRKEIVYEILNDHVCTYEMDDTPPFLINREALDIAIRLALLFQCRIVDEAHVSRKQYLDGSIPTGFQRTTIIGTAGTMPYKGRAIVIRQINVEEDACREVSDRGHQVVFRTDRLSTPLVEVITEPDMRTPAEAGEVTALLAEVNRISGLVRRGIGTARQDVNVSVAGGTRIEIKGVEKIGLIPALTHYEALRQRALLDLRDELRRRRVTKETFAARRGDVSAFAGRGEVTAAAVIKGYRGLPEWRVFPDRTFADEIGGRVRVIACLDEMPNLTHDAARAAAGIGDETWRKMRETLSAGENDAAIVTWGPRQDVETALNEIVDRCREAVDGVPSETRQVLSNGTYTDFERILPGPDRMYPDTDHPPIGIDEEGVRAAKAAIPEFPWVRKERLAAMGLSAQLIRELVVHPRFVLFETMAAESGNPVWAAVTVAETLTALRRSGRTVERLTDGRLVALARAIREKRLHREGAIPVLRRVCEIDREPGEIVDALIASSSGGGPDFAADELRRVKGLADRRDALNHLMGLTMKRHRGLIDGGGLWKRLSSLLDNVTLLLLLFCCLGCVTRSGDAPTVALQPEDLIAKAIDVVHARSLEGLTALIDKETVVQYGSSPGEGGWGAWKADTKSRQCPPAEFIKNIRWDFTRESAKVTIDRTDEGNTVAVARWLGRDEPGLDATLQIVFRHTSDGSWEIQTISLRENCTRNK